MKRSTILGVTAAAGFLAVSMSVQAATVAYWRFETAPGFLADSSGNSLTLINSVPPVDQVTLPFGGGGLTFPVSVLAQPNDEAASYDPGETDILDTGNTGSDLITTGEFTAEAFIRFDGFVGRGNIVAQWDFAVGERVFQFTIESGTQLGLWVSPDGGTSIFHGSGIPITIGNEYYVAAAFDLAGGTVTFYAKNLSTGTPLQTVVVPHGLVTLNADDRMTIGTIPGGSFNQFEGLIDEVRVSDAVLAVGDLLLNNATFPAPPTAVGEIYYRFEDSPGFTADSGGGGFDLVLGSGATQIALPATGDGSDFPDPIPVSGDPNDKAAEFDVASDLMDTGNAGPDILLPANSFTIEALANFQAAGGGRGVIAGQWDFTIAERVFQFSIESDRELSLALSPDGAANALIDSGLFVVPGDDYYLAAIFDNAGGTVTFYAQNLTQGSGFQRSTVPHPYTSINGDDRLTIGGLPGGVNGFIGLIDEVRLTSSILDDADLLIDVPDAPDLSGPTCLHFRFEDSPGYLVDSVNGVTLQQHSPAAPQIALPVAGAGSDFPDPVPATGDSNLQAADFLVAGDMLDTHNIGYSPIGDLGDAWTAEAFINFEGFDSGGRGTFVGQWDFNPVTGPADRSWMFSVEGGQLNVFLSENGAGNVGINSGLAITANDDYYVGLSFDLVGDVVFYAQNLTTGGPLLASTNSHSLLVLNTDDRLTVGGVVNGTGEVNEFRGVVDEVRISCAILTEEELLIASSCLDCASIADQVLSDLCDELAANPVTRIDQLSDILEDLIEAAAGDAGICDGIPACLADLLAGLGVGP